MSQNFQNLKSRLAVLKNKLDLPQKQVLLTDLKEQADDPNLWDDQIRAVEITTKIANLQKDLAAISDLEEMLTLGEGLSEDDLIEIDQAIQTQERQALLSDPMDQNNAIITIHAGTGGTDAQDFAEMLLRMYLRFVEQGGVEEPLERILSINRGNWRAELVECNKGEEAGIKKAVIEVAGEYAYGLLKGEAGVHRLVRQSPFNAKALRQTSFALVEVIPEVDQPKGMSIKDEELRIDVFRSGGHGGQGVNTTDSAVRITHLPTGIVVTVQNERSQHQNKALALKILLSRLALLQELKNAEEIAILKGEVKEGSWGNQIRSYVLHPYQMVKDHRTEAETSNTTAILDGQLKIMIEAYLLNQDKE